MEHTTLSIGNRNCVIYRHEDARHVFIQPVDDHDLDVLGSEIDEIARLTRVPFSLAAFKINDWNSELTPWQAPPAFGKKPFGNGASATLNYITQQLLPALKDNGINTEQCLLGGYSLAGLFALWAGYQTDIFSGIGAASPSVWYPAWIDYINDKKTLCPNIYLSLGDKEELTRNPIMAQVGNCIKRQHELLQSQAINTKLEWNPGNHFANSDKRMAKAFAWLLSQ